MASLLSLPNPPTAVFAESDEMAMGAMRTIRHSGLRCPDDISVVGFDDHELAEMMDLTTIAQPVREQGRIAAQLVLDRIAGAQATDRQLPTRIVLRASTCPPGEGGDPGRWHARSQAGTGAEPGHAPAAEPVGRPATRDRVPRIACRPWSGSQRAGGPHSRATVAGVVSWESAMSGRFVLFAAVYGSGPPALDGLRCSARRAGRRSPAPGCCTATRTGARPWRGQWSRSMRAALSGSSLAWPRDWVRGSCGSQP